MRKLILLTLIAVLIPAASSLAQSPFASNPPVGRMSFGNDGFRSPNAMGGYYAPGSGMTYSSTSGYSGPDYYNYYLRGRGSSIIHGRSSAFGGYDYTSPYRDFRGGRTIRPFPSNFGGGQFYGR